MICDNCYHRLSCRETPDNNDRCRLHLKNGSIELGDDLTIDPTDTLPLNYDDIKQYFGHKSSDVPNKDSD
jgi:hypothetical protein